MNTLYAALYLYMLECIEQIPTSLKNYNFLISTFPYVDIYPYVEYIYSLCRIYIIKNAILCKYAMKIKNK